jgi:hypothetical protein
MLQTSLEAKKKDKEKTKGSPGYCISGHSEGMLESGDDRAGQSAQTGRLRFWLRAFQLKFRQKEF